MKKTTCLTRGLQFGAALCALALLPTGSVASSHMDAPLITLDDAANTTDVYSFVTTTGTAKSLTTALAVYPFEEPGIGPNRYGFDDNVLYAIHIATGADLATGRATTSYEFKFTTTYKNSNTILQAFTGVVNSVDDANQNLTQTYTVTKVNEKNKKRTFIGSGIVPPNNQGRVTPKYNQTENGDNAAQEGVTSSVNLDDYTFNSIFLGGPGGTSGYELFAGQRDDGFYADIQSIFDLEFTFDKPAPFDSQGGFNVHTIVLSIPISELGTGTDLQTAGVYATTSRRMLSVLRLGKAKPPQKTDPKESGAFIQVGRQGNPLFCEAFISIKDKDLFNRTKPTLDKTLFRTYAETPQLAAALGLSGTANRTDLSAIFIPDLIKTDLSTNPVPLAGNPDQAGFHRLSVFGGDTVNSPLAGNTPVASGWPNGRRFGDDVLDIAVLALSQQVGPALSTDVDKVTSNDITYNTVFPYAATPHNGRNHPHH